MKKILLTLLLVTCTQLLLAFEPSALNLKVPSDLERSSMVFEIQHRFYGDLTEDPLENFFGLDVGANVNLGIRYAILDRLELYAAYTRFEKEYRVAASYAYHFPQIYVRTQINLEYFSFKVGQERQQNFFYGLGLQSEPIFDAVTATVNSGYDGYNEKFGLGFGIDLGFDWEFGPIEHVALLGEYYPVLQSEEPITGPENSFAGGVRVDTYGHHFMILIGNNTHIGARRLMLGAASNDIRLGLTVQRLLQF
ncbi:hypothetical protein AMJ83_11280 [candidate division WOR_3 bacterium SM23_42]|uniref:DUF5777 domain-containing protein n=1 Tax=candidate division WOR_3 bacterium SM23_42 TaxID=1703779 RepID=A0A0S8FNH4_UNCW3|nr:MAG: hypothetical protein AMJ83_11280 [candidate division WOR_3 bacterium SM23_42]